MDPGRLYDGRRQHQGRRPARTPAQTARTRRVVLWALAAMTATQCCFWGGTIVAGATWLLGWWDR